jgi:two-component system nitrogen regulation response regulator GlnG
LRKRKEDLVFLVKRVLDLTSQELGKNVRGVSAPAWEMIQAYDWPGNVRDLRNALRCAVLLANDHGSIMPEHLGTIDPMAPGHRNGGYADSERPACDGHMSLKGTVRRAAAQVERALLIQALQQAKGNKAQAARLLEIDYKTIHKKLKDHGISTRVGRD